VGNRHFRAVRQPNWCDRHFLKLWFLFFLFFFGFYYYFLTFQSGKTFRPFPPPKKDISLAIKRNDRQIDLKCPSHASSVNRRKNYRKKKENERKGLGWKATEYCVLFVNGGR
jgi:hypothetical protein